MQETTWNFQQKMVAFKLTDQISKNTWALTVWHKMTKNLKTWHQPEGLVKDNKKVWSSWTAPKNAALNKWQLSQEISQQLPQSTVSAESYSNMLTAFPTVGLGEQDAPQQSQCVGKLVLGSRLTSKRAWCSQFANVEQRLDNALWKIVFILWECFCKEIFFSL